MSRSLNVSNDSSNKSKGNISEHLEKKSDMGYEEMNKLISQLMDSSAVVEKRIKDITDENEAMKKEIQRLKKENIELSLYKDKYNDITLTYSQKEKEIENIKELIKQKKNDIERLKKENETVKELKKQINAKDELMQNLNNELEALKNLTKEDQIRMADGRTQAIENEIEKLQQKLQEQNAKYNSANDDYIVHKKVYEHYKEEFEKEQKEIDMKLKASEEETKKLKNDLCKIQNNCDGMQKKYDDSIAKISQLQNEYDNLRKVNTSQKRELNELKENYKDILTGSSLSNIKPEQINEIFSDNLSLIYTNSISQSFQDVINDILLNFDTILQSFLSYGKSGILQPITLSQETLKSIYFKLYSKALFLQNNSMYTPLNNNDFSEELLNQVAQEICSSNKISELNEGYRAKEEEAIKQLSELNIGEEMENQIRELFKKKSERNRQILEGCIKNLLMKCVYTIKDGAIEINKKKLFSFSTLFGSGKSAESSTQNETI